MSQRLLLDRQRRLATAVGRQDSPVRIIRSTAVPSCVLGTTPIAMSTSRRIVMPVAMSTSHRVAVAITVRIVATTKA